MNHRKLKVVKQEMARVNVDILGISKLKWANLIQVIIIIYYCGQECPRMIGVAFIGRESDAVLGYYLKNDRVISVCFQDKPFSIVVIQVYAATTNAKEAEVEQLYEDLQKTF